jgi:uncharacterized protein YkwD
MRKIWSFNAGRSAFTYEDDAFRATHQPRYAAGGWVDDGGIGGSGALQVRVGGVDNADVGAMSGAWTTSLRLDDPERVTLTFRLRLTQTEAHEADESSRALVALDGHILKLGGDPWIEKVSGGGASGWLKVKLDLGVLDEGRHTLSFGGWSSGKDAADERTTLLFDDIGIATRSALDAFEAEVLELVNDFRESRGRDPLGLDPRLNDAAENWSRQMGKHDAYQHSTPAQVEKYGYDWSNWGENIAAGYQTPEEVVDGWIHSPGHRANILSRSFEETGIGYYEARPGDHATYETYWTQVFGTEQDSLL